MANGLMFNEWFEFLQAISGVMPLIQSIFSVILALMASTAVHAEGLSKFDLECRGIDQVVAGGDGTETPKAWDMTISLDETQGIAFIHRAQVTVPLTVLPQELIVELPGNRLAVSRINGIFVMELRDPTVTFKTEVRGTCTVVPYTGMPARAF